MLRKICFITKANRYDSHRLFTQQFISALERHGVQCINIDIGEVREGRYLDDDKIAWIHQQNPDMTASFCHLLPSSDGRYLCDFLETPHLTILTDPLIWFVDVAKSSYSIIASVDRGDVQLLEDLGSKRAIFFPHAVEPSLFENSIDGPRPYEVSFVGSCFDYESIVEMWREEWDPILYDMAMDIIEIYKIGEGVYLPKIALQMARERDVPLSNIREFCYWVSNYIRGWDRIQMLKAVAAEHPLHIFGTNVVYPPMNHGWDHYLKDLPHIQFHDAVPFEQVNAIFSQSRVILNTNPFFYDGSHERIFYGLVLGASVITTYNDFVGEQFGIHQGVGYYKLSSWEMMAPEISYYLEDEERRFNQMLKGREIVRKKHTWDQRAEELMDRFPDLYCQVFTGDELSLKF